MDYGYKVYRLANNRHVTEDRDLTFDFVSMMDEKCVLLSKVDTISTLIRPD